MARMIGKTRWHHSCRYGCCQMKVPVHTAKRQEEREWRKEAEEDDG